MDVKIQVDYSDFHSTYLVEIAILQVVAGKQHYHDELQHSESNTKKAAENFLADMETAT